MRSDAEIADAVRDSFRFDPRLKTFIPQVAVNAGIVSLSGNVASPSARRAAEADAKDTVGVWNVHDQVVVLPNGTLTDADVNRAAKRVLNDDLLLPSAHSIQVSSAKGKVALRGTISSPFERFDAIADVARVPGVVEIDDALVVHQGPEQIKTHIEDRLFWDPMVDGDQVTVVVAPDGIATLSGTLDSWGQIKSAADDALRGGATRVVNALKLKKHPEVAVPQ